MNIFQIRAAWMLVVAALLVVSAAGFVETSRARQDRETQVFMVEPFDRISLRGAGDVVIRIGPEPTVEITTASAISGLFDATVVDGELQAGFGASVAFDLLTSGGIEYQITTPSLSGLNLTGPLNATIDGLSATTFELDLNRAAQATITNLEVTDLEIDLNFASSATISGSADAQAIDLRNGSTYDGASLETATTTVELANASKATVRVTESLSGSVRNASTLEYLTESAVVDVDVQIASSLDQLPWTPLAPGGTPVSEATPAADATVSTATTYNVAIVQFAFDPPTLEISVGDTVTWTNEDRFPHDVTQLPRGEGFASPTLAQGDTFSVTFDKPGTYDYYCALHPIMVGTIVVAD